MSKKTVCAIAIIIFLFNVVYLPDIGIIAGEPTAKFSYKSDIVQVLGVPTAPTILVSLEDESLVFINKLEECLRINTKEYGVIWKMDYIKEKNIVVAGTTKGYILIIDPFSHRIVDSIKIFDGPVSLLDVTNNGKYVVLTATKPMTVSGVRVTAESLIVYDLERRITVLYRDWNSKDRLAKVFKLKISDDDRYLIVEVLDKFCELCEVLEAKIEIYDLKSLRKICSKTLGLSVFLDIIDSLRILSIRRRLRAQGYITVVNIIEIHGEGELSEREFTLDFNAAYAFFLDKNKFFIRLSEPYNNIIGYIYSVKGSKIKSIKGDPEELLERVEGGVLGVSLKKITKYDPSMNVIWSKNLSVEGKTIPLFIGIYDNEEYVYVAFRKILYVIPRIVKYNLKIEFFDINNRKLSGVFVTIHDKEGREVTRGYSDLEGIFMSTLPSGAYELTISMPGYLNQTHVISLNKDLTLKFILEKIGEEPMNNITIKVFNKYGEPLENAIIAVLLPNRTVLYNYSIPKEGTTLRLRDGKYIIIASAPNFIPEEKTIILPGLTIVEFRLKFIRVNLTICVYNILNNYTTISIKGRYYENMRNISESCITFNNVPVGYYYDIYVSSGKYEKIERIYLTGENSTINVKFPGREDEVNGTLESSVQINVKDLVSIFENDKFLITEPQNEAIFFKARDNEGNIVNLEDYKGKIIILDFFYTQCEGCKYVIPFLRKINKIYGESVVLFSITISPSDTPSIVDAYVSEHNITWTVLHDDAGIYQIYNVTIFPTIVIIRPDGKIAYRIEGSYLEVESSKEQLVLLISGVLATVNQNPDYMILLAGLILLIFAVVAQYYISTFPEEEVIEDYGEEEIMIKREEVWEYE
ncbi:MAG: hypothetical protein DRJ38_03020 [Thermoprotei archaeon]|nr:MAG: hypothetical protein DRJ38_03020 [Thermoprotei archaeon]